MSWNNKVDTIARLAQWKVESTGSKTLRRSDPFKMGIWNWKLVVDRNDNIGLLPVPGNEQPPPLARYIVRVTTSDPNRRRFTSPVLEKLLGTIDVYGNYASGDFVCRADFNLQGRFAVDVEFVDLQIHGSKRSSIWPSECTMQHPSFRKCLSCMLKESIHTDVTINASDSTLRAHKAILCSSSPVFESMFTHNLKERKSSIVDIEDMSSESCTAMLSFMYGCINPADFWKHRTALLEIANKYDIVGLKDACEESLLEDISAANVLERLQDAWLHRLEKLKKGCLKYLLDFGMIYDLKDDICTFFRQTDKELAEDMFQELLSVWKPN